MSSAADMESYTRWLAAGALSGDPVDLPGYLDALLELAAVADLRPLVVAVLVDTGRTATATAAAGDPSRADLARWELEQIQGGVAPG